MDGLNNTEYRDPDCEVDFSFRDAEVSPHQVLECEVPADELTKLDKWTFAVLWGSAAVTVAALVVCFSIYVI
nr:putative 8 kDa transmembrane protein [wheat closterovirus 1]